jgi:acetolactate synthase-1/2/3 large subunit
MDALLTKSEEKVVKTTTQRISGSEALLRCLVAEDVETIFGYPGGAIMPVYDALYGYADKLTHILVRHEQGAIHAAQGFARVSGRPGIVFRNIWPGGNQLGDWIS